MKLLEPQVTFQQNDANLSIAGSLDDKPKTGWAVDPKFGEDHAASFGLEKPIGFPEGTRLTIRLEFNVNNKHNIGRLRLAISSARRTASIRCRSDRRSPTAEMQLLKLPDGVELTDAQRQTADGRLQKDRSGVAIAQRPLAKTSFRQATTQADHGDGQQRRGQADSESRRRPRLSAFLQRRLLSRSVAM